MKKRILKYNKYSFLKENFKLNETSEFSDMQLGLSNLVGPGYGFAHDSSLSIYSDGTTPYLDTYQRMSGIINDLTKVMTNLNSTLANTTSRKNVDLFLEDVENYTKLKILRIYQNETLKLDVFISFEFNDEEFFGVYRNFNNFYKKTKLDSDIFTDPRLSYIDKEYYLKLSNYIYKILYNWFIPNEGFYLVIDNELIVNNYMGQKVKIKKDSIIEVKSFNVDKDNEPYIILKYKNDTYTIYKNDYFYFKYRTEFKN